MKIELHLEDRELEEFILAESDTAIPLEIYLGEGEEQTEILVYPGCSSVLAPILESGADLFAPDTVESIRNVLTPFLDSLDFVPSPDGVSCICEYRMDSSADVRRSLILPGTELEIQREGQDDEAEESVSACHRVDGKKVAEAALNDLTEDEAVEIHVHCLPEYRGHGYASSCVAKLTAYYTENGCPVRYLCRIQNKASMHIAEKNGFCLEGKRLSFVYYRRGSL